MIAKGTRGGGIYLSLVLLEADPEPSPTGACTGVGPFTTTTLSCTVLAELVDEGLEAKLEHSGSLGLQQNGHGSDSGTRAVE